MSLLPAPKTALYRVYQQSTELDIFCVSNLKCDFGKRLLKFLDYTHTHTHTHTHTEISNQGAAQLQLRPNDQQGSENLVDTLMTKANKIHHHFTKK